MDRRAFLGLCRTSVTRFKYDAEGRIRRGGWLDPAHVMAHMDPHGEAKLLYWFTEAADSNGPSLWSTTWEIPLKAGGTAIGRLVVLAERLKEQKEGTK